MFQQDRKKLAKIPYVFIDLAAAQQTKEPGIPQQPHHPDLNLQHLNKRQPNLTKTGNATRSQIIKLSTPREDRSVVELKSIKT